LCAPAFLIAGNFGFLRWELLWLGWRYDDSAVVQVSTCVVSHMNNKGLIDLSVNCGLSPVIAVIAVIA
jgi:hypothetical protein